MLVSTLLVAVSAGLLAHWLWSRYQTLQLFSSQGIPGPQPNFFAGNVGQLIKGGLHNMVANWHKQYGKTYGIFRAGAPYLITADLNVLKQVFIVQFSNFANRRRNPFLSIHSPYVDMFRAVDKRWKKIRKSSALSFSSSKIKLMLPILNKLTKHSVLKLGEYATAKATVNMAEVFEALTLNVIGNVAFGIDLSDINDETAKRFIMESKRIVYVEGMMTIGTMIWVMFAMIAPKFVEYLLLYCPFMNPFGFKWLKKAAKNIIQQRMNNAQERRPDFIQSMIEHGKGDEERMTIEEMQGNSMFFIVAGHDTTATALSFLVYDLALAPEIQDRVVAEIAEVLPNKDSDVDVNDIEKMPYLDMVVQESLRLHPLGAGAAVRIAAKDTTIEGIFLPAGAQVQANVKAVHHDPKHWGPEDPLLFVPERFTPDRKAARHQLAYIPFGAGPRNCIAYRLALLEVKIIIIQMLQMYRFIRCAETEVPLKMAQIFIERPANGVYVQVEER